MNDVIIEEKIFEEFSEGNIIAREKINYLLMGDFELIPSNFNDCFILYDEDNKRIASLKVLEGGNYEVAPFKDF